MPDVTGTATAIQDVVGQLRAFLATRTTSSTVGMCFVRTVLAASSAERLDLLSPGKQLPFLVSLQLSTPEPSAQTKFSDADWSECSELLDKLFSLYQGFFWPTKNEVVGRSLEKHEADGIAFRAFLHYFNTGLMASVEQVEARIATYLSPFDSELRDVLGISATEAVEVNHWISARMQNALDELLNAMEQESRTRQTLTRGISRREAIERLRTDAGYLATAEQLFASVQPVGVIPLHELRSHFPEVADAYLTAFSIERGQGPHIEYPTEDYIADRRPIIRVSRDVGMCLSGNSLFTAVLRVSECTLAGSEHRTRFLSFRDRTLESEARAALICVVGCAGRVHSQVFETADAQFEHDTLTIVNNVAFLLEAKASPPKEPFRDPERSFTRLKRAFSADTGIQSGYDQALRLKRRLDEGHEVQLFDARGQLVDTVLRVDRVYSIVVTRDDFGPLATDLSVLLQKPGEEPYPWVVSVLDLQAIADGWSYLGWGVPEFINFLDGRVTLHGKVLGSDELEYAGFFIRHGGFESLRDPRADYINLAPSYSDWFDQLYMFRHDAGPPPSRTPGPPVISDLRRSLSEGRLVLVDGPDSATRSPGRRQPCPCGSGKRYKNCHGRRK